MTIKNISKKEGMCKGIKKELLKVELIICFLTLLLGKGEVYAAI